MRLHVCPHRKERFRQSFRWEAWQIRLLFRQMWQQRKFIQTIHAHAEAVRNIRNAAAESKKGQALKHEVIDRASR